MALPRAVQKQVEDAEAAHAAAYTVAPSDAVDPPAAAPETPSPTEPASAPAAPAAPAEENFEQKYKVIKGKYDNEVPRLHSELRDANRRLAQLEGLVADLNASRPAVPTAPHAQPPAGADTPTDITPEDVETYGQDFIDFVNRAARAAARAAGTELVEPLRGEVGSIRESLGASARRAQLSLQDQVRRDLDTLAPGWQQLDTDQEFLTWLAQQDPFSGAVRQELLNAAYTAGDANRVARFFNAYLQEHAAVTSSSPTPETGATPSRPRPAARLEDMAAPGRGKAAAPVTGAPNGKRHWTESDISKFYRDKVRGVYTADQVAALEADIFAAAREGRYSP